MFDGERPSGEYAVVKGDSLYSTIRYNAVSGPLTVLVEAGEYSIMEMSEYRQDQIDRAMSPLYAAIPVVIVLAVLGGVLGMLGTAFGRLKF